MRASATSRTVSYASPQASQAKSNASPADGASPFGQLLAATAPKQAGRQNDQKDASDSDDKAADQASAAKQDAKQDDNSAAIQTPAQPPSRPATKTGKADKNDDRTDAKTATKTESTADGSQNTAIDQQLAELQAVTPTASPQTQAAAADHDGDELALDKIAAAAQAGTPPAGTPQTGTPESGIPAGAGITDPAAAKASNTAAAQAASAQQADDSQTGDLELQLAAAARAQTAQAAGKSSPSSDDTAETGASAIAVNGGQIGVSNATQAGSTAKNATKNAKTIGNPGQAGTSQDADARIAAAQSGAAKTDIAHNDIDKNDVNKGSAVHNHDTQNDAANDIARDKADAATAAADFKNSSAHLDNLQPAAPKSAPPPMQAANINFDISGIAPQPGQPSTGTQQDIQVSAKPVPNLPALAVEISARSQSGAKQFDIRLDPPELGRVDVRLSIDATGKASAHLSADQPHTLTLLQNDAPALTRALRDAGLDVSQGGLNFSLRQQAENNGGNAGDNDRRGTSRAFSLTATADIDATAMTAAYRGAANGRLDIRV